MVATAALQWGFADQDFLPFRRRSVSSAYTCWTALCWACRLQRHLTPLSPDLESQQYTQGARHLSLQAQLDWPVKSGHRAGALA